MLMNMKDLLKSRTEESLCCTCIQYRFRPAVKGCNEESERIKESGYPGNESR